MSSIIFRNRWRHYLLLIFILSGYLSYATIPTARDTTLTIPEDQSLTFSDEDFPFSDPDLNASLASIRIIELPNPGALKYNSTDVLVNQTILSSDLLNGLLKFIPLPDDNGTPYSSLKFTVIDDVGDESVLAIMTLNVTAQNDPPTAESKTIVFDEDNTYIFTETDFGFGDIDGHAFSKIKVITSVSLGNLLNGVGTVVDNDDVLVSDITSENFKFTPALNGNGATYTTFTFKAFDETLQSSAERTITFNVVSVNDIPTSNDKTVIILEDNSKTFSSVDFEIIDDDGDGLSKIQITKLPVPGSLQLNSSDVLLDQEINEADISTLQFIPVPNEYGSSYSSFEFKVHDGTVYSSSPNVITIDVTAVDDPPTIDPVSDPIDIYEDALEQTINVTGISDGENESNLPSVTVTSSNTSLIPTPSINYTDATGIAIVNYTPEPDQYGSSTITVTVVDGTMSTFTEWVVNVISINDEPTITAVADQSTDEDVPIVVDISGIFAGPTNESGQFITIIAKSGNTSIIPDGVVDFVQPNPTGTGTITFSPLANAFGIVEITLTVSDDGGLVNAGDDDEKEITFNIEVISVNDPPELADISSPLPINEDAPQQSIGLSGISDGDPEVVQALVITATSDNTDLVETFTAVQNGSTATLSYQPKPDAYGIANIDVEVSDGDKSIIKSFVITVDPVNDNPTLDAITGIAAIDEDASEQTIDLSGITPGPNEPLQTVEVSASSDKPEIIPNPVPIYNAGTGIWSITYTPLANQYGNVIITVTVKDDDANQKIVSQSFTQVVNSVNDNPTLADLSNINVMEDVGEQSIVFGGISDDGTDPDNLIVEAFSSDVSIIPDPTVIYTSPNASGSIVFESNLNKYGDVIITIRVTDKDVPTGIIEKTFQVSIANVNDPPTLDDIPTQASILEDASEQTINLSGISPGPYELESFSSQASSDNLTLINNQSVTINGSSGTLTFTPENNMSGVAELTVTFDDQQGVNNTVSKNVTINVLPVNDSPGFDIPPFLAVSENSGLNSINAFANSILDGDPENQTLSFQISLGTPTSNLSFITLPEINVVTGDLTFETTENTNGTVNVDVTLLDDGGTDNGGINQITHSFSLIVTAVNDLPSFTLNGNPPDINEDAGLITISSFAQDIDDGDPELTQTLIFDIVQTLGDLTFLSFPAIDVSTGNLTYEVNPNINGSADFNVTLSETLKPANKYEIAFSITVNAVNDPPVGGDESLTIDEDVLYAFQESDVTFSDLDNHAFEGIQIDKLPIKGQLLYGGSEVFIGVSYPDITQLTYTPGSNENGLSYATFDFFVRDESGDLSTSSYSMTINVNALADDPTGAISSINTDEDQTYTFIDGDFPFSDSDAEAFNGIIIQTNVTAGELLDGVDIISSFPYTINDITNLKFLPELNQTGSPYASFSFHVIDAGDATSESDPNSPYAMTIHVGPVNDRPTGADDEITVFEDQTYTFSEGDFTFSDNDNHGFNGIQVTEIESLGALKYNGSDVEAFDDCPDVSLLTYTPPTNQNGVALTTFKFKVKDDSDALNISTSSYTMTINTTAINDAPIFTITEDPPTINEGDGAQSLSNFISTFGDGDDQTQELSFNLTFTPSLTLTFSNAPDIDEITGALTYTPEEDAYGSVTISVTLSDNGGTANGGSNLSSAQEFIITVNPINDPPTLDDISGTYIINEDASTFNIDLSGISTGSLKETQAITIEASSSDINIIANPSVIYTSPNATGQLALSPIDNANGTVTITVTVNDGQSTNSSISKTFDVTINEVNDPPTLNVISDPIPIYEDALVQTIGISGISAGPNESQPLIVSAVSSNVALIATPTINYNSPDAIGSISYQPVANQSGTAEITITVEDDGTSNKSIERKFNIQVLPMNDAPIFTISGDPPTIDEDAGAQTIVGFASFIDDGDDDLVQNLTFNLSYTAPLTLTFASVPIIDKVSGNLTYTTDPNAYGTITVDVILSDDGGTVNGGADQSSMQQFTLSINSINDQPTLNAIDDPAVIDEDAGLQTINLDGISAGGGENQPLSIYAESSNESIIKNPTIVYTDGNSTATLSYTPEENQSGSVVITVYVDDLSGINNLVSKTFTVGINGINNLPTINDIISPGDILEDASEQTVALSGITAGGGESQTVVVTALERSGNDIVENIVVNYSGNNNASLLFTPSANANGSTIIDVTVDDQQSVNNQITKSFNVTILKVNDPPTLDAIPSPFNIDEDAGQQTIVLTGITEGPNESEQSVTVTVVSDNTDLIPNPMINPKTATTRDLVFTAEPNKNGSAKITVTVDDVMALNNIIIKEFIVNVNAVNNPPDFSLDPDINILENDGVKFYAGFANDITDGDSELTQTLTFDLAIAGTLSFKTLPTISPANGDLTFETAQNSNGEAAITVTLSDNGTPPTPSTPQIFKINALPVNGEPSFTLNGTPPASLEDAGPVIEPAFAQDIDDGDPELDQSGSLDFILSIISGDLSFDTNPDINPITGDLAFETSLNSFGSSLISVILFDDAKSSTPSFFTLTVNPVNDSPVGSDETITIDEDSAPPYNFKVIDFTYSDIEADEFNGIQIVTLESIGNLEYNGSDVTLNQICPVVSLLVYKPALNGNGNDYADFEFKLRDAQGMLSTTYKMTVDVNPVDDDPSSGPAEVSILEGEIYPFNKTDFPFTDPDGDTFSAIRIYSVETRGVLKYGLNDVIVGTEITNFNQLAFTPAANENGTPYSTFEFEVKDSKGAYSSEFTMSIIVGATNDRPTGANETVTLLEDNNNIFSGSDFTFNDVDGHLFDGIRIESLETNGDLEYNGSDVSINQICPDVTKLIFKPDPNENGSVYSVFTFKVKDNSTSLNLSSADYTMTINVIAVNDAPVFTITGNPLSINEDLNELTEVLNFATSMNSGDPEATQTLGFNNPELQSSTGNLSFAIEPSITNQGTLTYQADPNTYGTTTYTVTLSDNGGIANGGQDESTEQSFTISVNGINDQPTINPIADQLAIDEDANVQTVNMANITAGPLENQELFITVESTNEALIPIPTIIYSSPNPTGSLSYKPEPDQYGESTITITVDDKGTTNGIIQESFIVTVNPVNDPPTINSISDPGPILENAGEQILNFDGITAGGGENQDLFLTVSSSNLTLIPTPVLTYLGGATAQISYSPVENENGISTITITVDDQNGKTNQISFDVNVLVVNEPPTLDPISKPDPIQEDSGEQQITLTGITPGINEDQVLTITLQSSNTELLSNITLDYTYPSTTGILSFTTNENEFGTTIITVTVDDQSPLDNLTSRQFTVDVLPVPDSPSVTPASTDEGSQSTSGLVITRNANDGEEVSFFKITNIQYGTLFMQDGITEIIDGEFIPYDQANLGLRFTPNSTIDGSFDIQASLSGANSGLGGALTTATIYINSIPTTKDLPNLTLDEDSPQIIYDLYQYFDDKEDLDIDLKFNITQNTAPEIVNVQISGQTLSIDFIKNQFGASLITVVCTDTKGAYVEDVIALTINPVNDTPIIDSEPVLSVDQDQLYEYNITSSDIEEDNRYFTLVGPAWLSLIDNGDGNATLNGIPSNEELGDFEIEINVIESSSSLSASQVFTLSIINVNDTPRFVSTPTLEVLETQKYEYIIEVLDPDPNDNLNVQVVLPPELDWLVLSSEAPYVLQGFPQIGDEGSYEIKLFVIDREGLVDEQVFTIIVKAENNPPTITDDLKIVIKENQVYTFKLDDFKNLFDDIDSNDSLVYIIITGLADHGRLTLGSDLVNENDIIFSNEIDQLIFTPDRNYSGLNFFTWKASDGKASSLSESRVEITTNSIDNPPEIINLESNSINYEFGDFYAQITETAEVVEYDGEEIVSARFTISSNYNDKQDFLSIDEFDGITSDWNDTTGVLSVSGPKSTEVYQQVLRSLIYTNQKRFAPSTNSRTIELLVFDGELESPLVYREIDFEDTFNELEIPSGFTPNQDGVNDTWEIEYIDSHDDALVRIYSREGILVYESIGNYKEWDGVYNGSVSKPGVYYYTIEIIKFEKKYSGSVTILR